MVVYPDNFEQKIGFDLIRERLKSNCLSSLGESEVDGMQLSVDYDNIKTILHEVSEFLEIVRSGVSFPTEGFLDMRAELRRIRIEGTWIDALSLSHVGLSLSTVIRVVTFLNRKKGDGASTFLYPYLRKRSEQVSLFPAVVSRIRQIVNESGEVVDTASPELSRIRQNLASLQNSLSKMMNRILNRSKEEGVVEKDAMPTIRDGRLVLPVIPAFKRRVRGIVHDESATGKTLFIEPAEMVEANNKIRELKGEERKEIIRLLKAFCDEIRPYIAEMILGYDFLAKIDFIRSKALFADSVPSVMPLMENKPLIQWYGAKHPLLYFSLQAQGKEVVPMNVELNAEHRILVISGPNAGGKSVCLKTVALLQYMLQCGMLLPLEEHSKVGVFTNILLDIGDEQSIDNDLSTYSSHLQNMKIFARSVTPKTLFLIDEFGGGTEPQIGGAIAEALLDKFRDAGALGVITTHYQNLKMYATNHHGVMNGAMLYDRHRMEPLFKLEVGNPGSSFAIEIAHKIGLPNDVIAYASRVVGSDYINLDKYLQDIVRDKKYWESKRQQIRIKEKNLESLQEKLDSKINKLIQERKSIIESSKEETQRIISRVNSRIEQTIKQIKEAQAERERTKTLRADLNKDIQNAVTSLDLKATHPALQQKNRKKSPKGGASSAVAEKTQPVEVGDYVRIKGQSALGKVLRKDGKKVEVAFGIMRTQITLDKVERASSHQMRKEQTKEESVRSSTTIDVVREKRLHFKQDIDVRGLRVDEAIQAVTYFVDDAIQLGVSNGRILHGTGTGALRSAIREYLKGVSGVKRFADEHVDLGGAGITVVEFN